ncbi:MAG: tyrosine-protein phosphatase [Clostridiales bacterium]|nr:tyrosine-protein phosphatase [Clostridiales bacterium]
MNDNIRVSQPLPLDGAKNVRDLGGYPAKDGSMTASRVFLRADGLQNLTNSDIQELTDYGVCRIIDLRSDREREMMPDRIGFIPGYHVGLLDQMNSEGFQGNGPDSMYALYQTLLDHSSEQIGTVIHLLAEVKERVVLYHCTGGKDRTGIISMLLLDLAGVPEESIIADYSITETYMESVFAKQKEQLTALGVPVQDSMFQSKPEDMEQTMRYFREKYTDAENYLIHFCKCSKDDVEWIRSRLLKNI